MDERELVKATVPLSIGRVLEDALSTVPDSEAVVGRSARLTYRQLDVAADRAAAALLQRGIGPGDRVAASLPNDVDIVVAFHAAMRIGAIWVGVNRNLAPAEKAYILDDGGAAVLLCDGEVGEQVGALREQPSALRDVVVVEPGDLALGRAAWAVEVGDVDLGPLREAVDPLGPAALAYTSGTTGRPKGVIHSQHNLLVPGAVLVATRGYGTELRKGDCLPLTILNMLVLTTLLTAQARGRCIVMDRLDAAGIAAWIRDEEVTTWNGVPAMLSSLNADESVSPDDLASLDEVWTGGDSCPLTIRARFEQKFGLRLVSTYGLTEAPTVVSIDDRQPRARAGESGRHLPHLEVTIRDADDRELPLGEAGEVCVAGTDEGPWAGLYTPMLGYHGHDEATRSALRNGRLHTGDIGSLDADGFLTLHARRSAVIIRGGANVYPAEVERVILELPGVAACTVFGVPDERLGERVAAALEIDRGTAVSVADVIDACAAQLARYKVPEQVAIVDQLPRNAMGKVERTKLTVLVAEQDRGTVDP